MKNRKLQKPPKIVRVIWDDAHSSDPWEAKKCITDRASRCVTVGFLVKENKHTLSIAGSGNFTGKPIHYSCVMTVPRGCVVKVEKLA